jgi:hypothetical protein
MQEQQITTQDEPDWDINKVRGFFGGTKPLDPSTVWRGVAKGWIPKPFYPTPGSARWSPAECRTMRARRLAERDAARAGAAA